MSQARMPDEQEAPDVLSGPTWTSEEHALELYADAVQIAATFFSFILEFGLSQRSGGGRLVARVRMSPEHAKEFALILLNGIRLHELQTGHNIPVQPGTMQRIDLENLIIQIPDPSKVPPPSQGRLAGGGDTGDEAQS
jgi:hypothetical protein